MEEEKEKRRDKRERSGGSGVALRRPKCSSSRQYGVFESSQGATTPIDRAPTPLNWRGGGLPTSLRLGGSEDLRLRSEATRDLTRRWDGEFISVHLCIRAPWSVHR